MFYEPGFIVVEADIAVIHGQQAILLIQLKMGRNFSKKRRIVGHEDAGTDGPR
ncbi:MAG: hypothetical protein ACD_75C00188G0002 [uncultured bacterium]|nr:MAG: hypothetical protein ACD_75C00188G0002 [uncultured bacterium]